MYLIVLFITLLLVHLAAQTLMEIQADCNEDISLQCPGVDSSKFFSVTWYKFIDQRKAGIVRTGFNKPPEYYNFNRLARFGEGHSLFLSQLTPADSGIYECAIGANVGGQHLNPTVNLTVSECVTVPTVTSPLITVTEELNTTHTNAFCHKNIEELSVMWSIIGYSGVGLAKIVFSLISIKVARAILNRSSRRDQQTRKT
ncbi:hypothetical protein LDENG_00206070 [Lucifuga dentata]|nr:hypothetical protein LDENG_00206070 [Lucifuga dentata]